MVATNEQLSNITQLLESMRDAAFSKALEALRDLYYNRTDDSYRLAEMAQERIGVIDAIAIDNNIGTDDSYISELNLLEMYNPGNLHDEYYVHGDPYPLDLSMRPREVLEAVIERRAHQNTRNRDFEKNPEYYFGNTLIARRNEFFKNYGRNTPSKAPNEFFDENDNPFKLLNDRLVKEGFGKQLSMSLKEIKQALDAEILNQEFFPNNLSVDEPTFSQESQPNEKRLLNPIREWLKNFQERRQATQKNVDAMLNPDLDGIVVDNPPPGAEDSESIYSSLSDPVPSSIEVASARVAATGGVAINSSTRERPDYSDYRINTLLNALTPPSLVPAIETIGGFIGSRFTALRTAVRTGQAPEVTSRAIATNRIEKTLQGDRHEVETGKRPQQVSVASAAAPKSVVMPAPPAARQTWNRASAAIADRATQLLGAMRSGTSVDQKFTGGVNWAQQQPTRIGRLLTKPIGNDTGVSIPGIQLPNPSNPLPWMKQVLGQQGRNLQNTGTRAAERILESSTIERGIGLIASLAATGVITTAVTRPAANVVTPAAPGQPTADDIQAPTRTAEPPAELGDVWKTITPDSKELSAGNSNQADTASSGEQANALTIAQPDTRVPQQPGEDPNLPDLDPTKAVDLGVGENSLWNQVRLGVTKTLENAQLLDDVDPERATRIVVQDMLQQQLQSDTRTEYKDNPWSIDDYQDVATNLEGNDYASRISVQPEGNNLIINATLINPFDGRVAAPQVRTSASELARKIQQEENARQQIAMLKRASR